MIKAQVIWSTEALVDLETIHYFLVEKSEQVAQQITENILARIEQIETFPESGAIQKILKSTGRKYRYWLKAITKLFTAIIPHGKYLTLKRFLIPGTTQTNYAYRSSFSCYTFRLLHGSR